VRVMYGCYQYLLDNGYERRSGRLTPGNSTTEVFEKKFDGYEIVVESVENEYGGRQMIYIHISPPATPKDVDARYHRLSVPKLSFFATGYHDYAAFEKKAKEMVAKLKDWTIEVL
jgi:hypothetical protein